MTVVFYPSNRHSKFAQSLMYHSRILPRWTHPFKPSISGNGRTQEINQTSSYRKQAIKPASHSNARYGLPEWLFLLWLCCHWLPASASPTFFTSSNDAVENQIIRYQSHKGLITETGRFVTGGRGTGKSLPAANSLALSHDRRWLLTVNAGSDQISVFRLDPRGPRLTGTTYSGGKMPLSIALRGRRVYVLNGGSSDIASYQLTRTGRLEPLGDGSVHPLSSTAARATDIGVTADGRLLVIAERGVNRLTTFGIGRNGVLSQEAKSIETPAKSPYALNFLGKAVYTVFAGERPGQSAVGAYQADQKGVLAALGEPRFTGQTAACWSALSPRRRLLYTANAGSHSLSGLRLGPKGKLALLNPNGISVDTGLDNHPRDMTLTRDEQTLAVILSGEHTLALYQVGQRGKLSPRASFTSIPNGAAGIVAN